MSAYAGAPDPLVRPDYTGAAPDKPGVSTATALDAAVDHHAEASGENLAQLATTSEASLEGSSRTGSTVAASPVTVSTHQKPSPFARRYLSDYSFRGDSAKAVKSLIRNLPDKVSVSDYFLRNWIGRDPIDSIESVEMSFASESEDYGMALSDSDSPPGLRSERAIFSITRSDDALDMDFTWSRDDPYPRRTPTSRLMPMLQGIERLGHWYRFNSGELAFYRVRDLVPGASRTDG